MTTPFRIAASILWEAVWIVVLHIDVRLLHHRWKWLCNFVRTTEPVIRRFD